MTQNPGVTIPSLLVTPRLVLGQQEGWAPWSTAAGPWGPSPLTQLDNGRAQGPLQNPEILGGRTTTAECVEERASSPRTARTKPGLRHGCAHAPGPAGAAAACWQERPRTTQSSRSPLPVTMFVCRQAVRGLATDWQGVCLDLAC